MQPDMTATPWLVRQPSSAPRLRLYCFSYAGGSAAAFHGWQASLHPAVEVCAVQLPGRSERLMEAPLRSLAVAVETLAGVLAREDDTPFAFFGHSLGSLLAFELARHLRRTGRTMPVHLFASGSVPPCQRMLSRRLHELDDAALLSALRQYNGAPAAALDHPELMALMLPTIRADFALAADYRYQPEPALPLPITALGGAHDPHVAVSSLAGWAEESAQESRIYRFEGDHFFIQGERAAVLGVLRRELLQHLELPA